MKLREIESWIVYLIEVGGETNQPWRNYFATQQIAEIHSYVETAHLHYPNADIRVVRQKVERHLCVGLGMIGGLPEVCSDEEAIAAMKQHSYGENFLARIDAGESVEVVWADFFELHQPR